MIILENPVSIVSAGRWKLPFVKLLACKGWMPNSQAETDWEEKVKCLYINFSISHGIMFFM